MISLDYRTSRCHDCTNTYKCLVDSRPICSDCIFLPHDVPRLAGWEAVLVLMFLSVLPAVIVVAVVAILWR